ncbi:MAG: response regulator transcription factor [Pseudomonadota bacterium]|nr:response regulator transcription factor [Pseudomonadota bacterium]
MKRAVLIADDHPLFRDALKLAVAQAVPGAQIVEADSVHTLFAALDAHPDPELLLLDLNMPGAQGFNALVQARANFPTVPIVVISAREDRRIMQRALGHGAAAFVPKSASIDLIVTALRAVLGGDTWLPASASGGETAQLDQQEVDATTRLATLTPQQFRVLSMLSAGLLNKQIAAELAVSEATVKAHVSAVMQKLGVSNRTQAVLLAQKLSLDQQ